MSRAQLQEGQEIEIARKHMTLAKLRLYHGPAINNHTDYGIAEEQKLGAPVAGGMIFMGHLSTGFCSLFGPAWLEGGSMEVKFLDYVRPGDEIVYSAKVSKLGDPIELDVACHSGDRLIMVGTATVPNG